MASFKTLKIKTGNCKRILKELHSYDKEVAKTATMKEKGVDEYDLKQQVRRLLVCETMGSATKICSDKTGTLTLNQMIVVKECIIGESRDSQKSGQDEPSLTHSLLMEGIVQNTAGSVFKSENGMDFNSERSKSSLLHVFTFNSESKRGGIALKMSTNEVHIHWKGAAEIILDLCEIWIDDAGAVQQMTPERKNYFKKIIEGMVVAALRCVAFPHRTYDLEKVPTNEEQLQSWQIPDDKNVACFVKERVKPNRLSLKEKISVHPPRRKGLKLQKKIYVMGRSSPNDKLLLVQALRKKGHIVAVTGDGTNDAPALHEADIGLSMGIQGTEVAKESSDIIILDDNFASVVKVVRWGRSVYANIQKFIQFQLTVNVAALAINFVAAISAGEVPLTAVQLLWVNLIMDTLGALALATEPPTDHLMDCPPVGRREPLITNIMWRNLLGQAMYQIVVLLTLQFRGIEILKLQHHSHARAELVKNTLIFNAFVWCQIFNEFNARKHDQINIFKGLLKSRLFVAIIAFTIVLQILIIQFAGRVASTTKLNWQQWIICIVIGFISWPLAALVKMIPVTETPFLDYFKLKKYRKSSSSVARNPVSRSFEENGEEMHRV